MQHERLETPEDKRGVNKMRPKEEYFKIDGSIFFSQFNIDIRRAARDCKQPVPVVLRDFFKTTEFSKREMGDFAFGTSHGFSLIEAAVTLVHALGITEEEAPSSNIIVEYFGQSPTDPIVLGDSLRIDTMLNWEQGTVMPQTKNSAFNF